VTGQPPGQAGIYRRFVLGGAGKIVSLSIQFGEQFLLVPVFLLLWGADRYGDWLVLMSAAGFVGLVDMGLQAYLSNALQMIWARDERAAFQRTLKTGLGIYALIIAIVAPLVIAGGAFGMWTEWLNLKHADASGMGAALTLLAGEVAVLGIVIPWCAARIAGVSARA
jgi:hypothetical protein